MKSRQSGHHDLLMLEPVAARYRLNHELVLPQKKTDDLILGSGKAFIQETTHIEKG